MSTKKKTKPSTATLIRRADRQRKIDIMREYGYRCKDAQNQSRGEASKITWLYKKVKEFASDKGQNKYQFVKNKDIQGTAKQKKKIRKTMSAAGALGTGLFVIKSLGEKIKIDKEGDIIGTRKFGKLAEIQSFFIPYDVKGEKDLPPDDLEDIHDRIENKCKRLAWVDWTVTVIFDGRASVSKFDITTFRKEMRNYIGGNKEKGRKLDGYLVQRILVDAESVLGALEKSPAGKTNKSK